MSNKTGLQVVLASLFYFLFRSLVFVMLYES